MQAGMASRSLGTHGGWNLKKMHVWQLSWQGLMRRDCLSPQRLIQLRKRPLACKVMQQLCACRKQWRHMGAPGSVFQNVAQCDFLLFRCPRIFYTPERFVP